jgi:iron(III) transport system substrate-binding protein
MLTNHLAAPAHPAMKRLLLTLISVLLVTGGGCSFPSSGADARLTGGNLTILGTAEEEYVRGIARSFELDTGIHTKYVRQSAGEALDTLRTNAKSPTFSVWWGGSVDGYIAAADEGLLEAYRPKGSSVIPNQYKDAAGAWTGIYVGVLAIAVNTRVLAERNLPEPGSWADLIKPVYKGQVSVAHPATSGTAFTLLSTIMQLNDRDLDKGFAYLQALNQNVAQYQRAGANPARIAGRGELPIGIAFAHDIVATIEDGASDLKLVYPSEGTGYEIGGMALVKDAPAPKEAKAFLDWALTEKAQELGPLFTAYQIPTNPDAKVADKSAKLAAIKTIAYDFRWAGDNRAALVRRFSAFIAPPPPQ